MLALPAEVLFEIEHELNESRFMGVPIGSTLGDVFNIYLFHGQLQSDFKSVQKDRLRFWKHYVQGARRTPHQTANFSGKRGRVLVTYVNDRPHIHRLMAPVLERLGPKESIVLLRDNGSVNPFFTDSIGAASLPYDGTLWRKEFHRRLPVWRSRIKSILDKYKIPRPVLPKLLDAMLVNSQRVVAYHVLLDSLQPHAVVTEFDRNLLVSGLILAARSVGIPTMTMLHGVINPPYGYVPLIADLAFCWGQQSFDQMVAMGTDPARLVIAGHQGMTPGLAADRQAARAKLGITDERTLVLLASNPINIAHRKKTVRAFCEAFQDQNEIVAVVRLHPAETLSVYDEEIKDFSTARFTEASFMTQDAALAAADVIVNRDSGFGNDALVKGKFVVILDVINTALGNARSLIEQAGCPHTRSSDALRDTVKRIRMDAELRERLNSKGREYVKYQFAAYGDHAAENILAIIRNPPPLSRSSASRI